MPRRAAQPALYSTDSGKTPELHGRRCRSCGYVFFPPHDFGCERCGALPAQIEAFELASTGQLSSFATVHLHPGGAIEPPFTVGEIVLDSGPTVRALLVSAEGLVVGARMRGVLCPIDSSDESGEVVELRFEPAAPTSAGAGGGSP